MKITASVTMLSDRDGVKLEIRDENACVEILKMHIPSQDFTAMIGRLAHVKVEDAEVYNLDKVGTIHECDKCEFEIPNIKAAEAECVLNNIAIAALKERGMSEWTPDSYYSSQNSFFKQGGQKLCSCDNS